MLALTSAMVFPVDIAGRTIRNITDRSRCVITEFLSDTMLSCELEGGEDNTWSEGDKYEIVGNPLDMLKATLDNLHRLATRIAVPTTPPVRPRPGPRGGSVRGAAGGARGA